MRGANDISGLALCCSMVCPRGAVDTALRHSPRSPKTGGTLGAEVFGFLLRFRGVLPGGPGVLPVGPP